MLTCRLQPAESPACPGLPSNKERVNTAIGQHEHSAHPSEAGALGCCLDAGCILLALCSPIYTMSLDIRNAGSPGVTSSAVLAQAD